MLRLVALTTLLASGASLANRLVCPENFTAYPDDDSAEEHRRFHCLSTALLDHASWRSASDHCKSIGGMLASFDSRRTYERFADRLQLIAGNSGETVTTWYIGLHSPRRLRGVSSPACPSLTWSSGNLLHCSDYGGRVRLSESSATLCRPVVHIGGSKFFHPIPDEEPLAEKTHRCPLPPRSIVTCQAPASANAGIASPSAPICSRPPTADAKHSVRVPGQMSLTLCKQVCLTARRMELSITFAGVRGAQCSCLSIADEERGVVPLPWTSCSFKCAGGAQDCGGPEAVSLLPLGPADRPLRHESDSKGGKRKRAAGAGWSGSSMPQDCSDLYSNGVYVLGNYTLRNGTSALCGFTGVALCDGRDWFAYAGGCYLVRRGVNASDVKDAAGYCYSQSAELMVVNDEAEALFVESLLSSTNITSRAGDSYWTGFYTHKATKWWHAADGSILNPALFSGELDLIVINRTIQAGASYTYYVKQMAALLSHDPLHQGTARQRLRGDAVRSDAATVQICEIRKGFLGCYEINWSDGAISALPRFVNNRTLNAYGCLEYCRGLSFSYAATSADACVCLDRVYGRPINGSDCIAPCPDRSTLRACASSNTTVLVRRIADYETIASSCDQLWRNGAYQPSWYKISVGGTIVTMRCFSAHLETDEILSNSSDMASSALNAGGPAELLLSGAGLFFRAAAIYDVAFVEINLRAAYAVHSITVLGIDSDNEAMPGTLYTGWPRKYRIGYKRSIYDGRYTEYFGDITYQMDGNLENEEDFSMQLLQPFVAEVIKLRILDARYTAGLRLSLRGKRVITPPQVCRSDSTFTGYRCVRENTTYYTGCYMDGAATERFYDAGSRRLMAVVPATDESSADANLTFEEKCRTLCMDGGFVAAGIAYPQASAVIYPDTVRLGVRRNPEAFFQVRKDFFSSSGKTLPLRTVFALTACMQLMVDAVTGSAAVTGNWSRVLISQYNWQTDAVLTISYIRQLTDSGEVYAVEARIDQLREGRRQTSKMDAPNLEPWQFYTLCLTWDSNLGFTLYASLSSETRGNASHGPAFSGGVTFSPNGTWRLGDSWFTEDIDDPLFNLTSAYLSSFRSSGDALFGYSDSSFVGWMWNVHIFDRILNGDQLLHYGQLCELICWDILGTWMFSQKRPGLNGNIYLDGEGPLGMEDFRITVKDLMSFHPSIVFSDCDWTMARLNVPPLTADLYTSGTYHIPAWCPWSQRQRSYLIVRLQKNTVVTGFAFQGYLGRIVPRVQIYFTNDLPTQTFDSNYSVTYDLDFGLRPYVGTDRRSLPYPMLTTYVLFRAANMTYSLNTTSLRIEIYGFRFDAKSGDRQQFRNGSVCGCLTNSRGRGLEVLDDASYCSAQPCTGDLCRTRAFYKLLPIYGNESLPAFESLDTACNNDVDCTRFGSSVCDARLSRCRCRVGFSSEPVCVPKPTTTAAPTTSAAGASGYQSTATADKALTEGTITSAGSTTTARGEQSTTAATSVASMSRPAAIPTRGTTAPSESTMADYSTTSLPLAQNFTESNSIASSPTSLDGIGDASYLSSNALTPLSTKGFLISTTAIAALSTAPPAPVALVTTTTATSLSPAGEGSAMLLATVLASLSASSVEDVMTQKAAGSTAQLVTSLQRVTTVRRTATKKATSRQTLAATDGSAASFTQLTLPSSPYGALTTASVTEASAQLASELSAISLTSAASHSPDPEPWSGSPNASDASIAQRPTVTEAVNATAYLSMPLQGLVTGDVFNLSAGALGNASDGAPSQTNLWWIPVLVVILNIAVGIALYLYCQKRKKKNKIAPAEDDAMLKLGTDS